MSDPTNPYEPPAIQADSAEDFRADQILVPAGKGLRFANFIIDYIAQFVMAFVVGSVVTLTWGEQGSDLLETIPDVVFGVFILLIYYLVLEGTTSRTLGKLVTGTKVVNEQSGKPTFGQVAGRTFARLIPFEAFSFLGLSGRGLHDALPKTYVIKTRGRARPATLWKEALRAESEHDFPEAVRFYNQIVKLYPSTTWAADATSSIELLRKEGKI